MVKKIQESKEKKALKASSTSKKEKKKWTEVKKKEDARKLVTVSDELLAKVRKDLAKTTLITRYMLGMRYNLNMSVAENLLRYFWQEGVVEKVRSNSRMTMYASGAAKETTVASVVQE